MNVESLKTPEELVLPPDAAGTWQLLVSLSKLPQNTRSQSRLKDELQRRAMKHFDKLQALSNPPNASRHMIEQLQKLTQPNES